MLRAEETRGWLAGVGERRPSIHRGAVRQREDELGREKEPVKAAVEEKTAETRRKAERQRQLSRP